MRYRIDGPKTCRVCNVLKENTDFPYYGNRCKACQSAFSKKYYVAKIQKIGPPQKRGPKGPRIKKVD